jgi:hypothetical protein
LTDDNIKKNKALLLYFFSTFTTLRMCLYTNTIVIIVSWVSFHYVKIWSYRWPISQLHGWMCVFFYKYWKFLILTHIRVLSKFLISLSKMSTSPPKKTHKIYTKLKNCLDLQCRPKKTQTKSFKTLKTFTHAVDQAYSMISRGRLITPTLINNPTMHPGLYHHILSNRNSKQL